jgi:hypothetical protein
LLGGGASTFVYRSAAARRLMSVGGGRKIFSGAPAAARRPETPDPNFTLSVQYNF